LRRENSPLDCFLILLTRMARGFIYRAAVPDWFTRRVLAWRVSITLEADFCMQAVEEALAKHGNPEIFNTDQGSQFTSTDFIKVGFAVRAT
jgi:putative transposase